MELSKRIDSKGFPMPKNLANPESFRIYNLQGGTETHYYTDGHSHGFISKTRVITDARYTSQHRAFNINGIDKYDIGYLSDGERRPHKLEFIELETGKRVLPFFDAFTPGERYLSFRINSEDGDITKHRWGVFDMLTGQQITKVNIPTSELLEMSKKFKEVTNAFKRYLFSD